MDEAVIEKPTMITEEDKEIHRRDGVMRSIDDRLEYLRELRQLVNVCGRDHYKIMDRISKVCDSIERDLNL